MDDYKHFIFDLIGKTTWLLITVILFGAGIFLQKSCYLYFIW